MSPLLRNCRVPHDSVDPADRYGLRRRDRVMQHLRMRRPVDLEAVLDEQHAALLGSLPIGLLDLSDLQRCRVGFDAFAAAAPTPTMPKEVEVTEVYVPGFEAEAPAPAQIHDCYAAFCHLTEAADDLGIDPARIVIAGASAGGGLAAGTALFARDRGGPQPVAQLLVYPMLDHRNATPSSHAIQDSRVWNRNANLLAWDHYLGGRPPSIYTSPAICDDLAGLPPAYITVGTLDMFLDEDVAYAVELNRCGVPCELHVFPGAFHLSQNLLPDHPTSRRWRSAEEAFVQRALAGNV